jgi:hypothetical protein
MRGIAKHACLALCAAVWAGGAWAQGPPPRIEDNRQAYPESKVPTYRKLEVTFTLPTQYANPFAPYPVNPGAAEAEQVDELGAKADVGGVMVTGVFERPGGEALRVPGFWAGDTWRVRMTPTEPGDWSYHIEIADAMGTRRLERRTFTATRSDDAGFVRVVPGSRFFAFESGAPFIPLGNNLVKTTDAEVIRTWAERLQAHRMNSQRIWLHPHYTAIEWSADGIRGPSFVPDAPGLGRYCLRTARSMDYTVEEAERNGLYAILCQDDTICYENSPHHEPRIGWEYNPYRPLCKDGIEFFTNDLAKRYYKRRLRYMVARWGYSTHVFSWELQNEVDWPYFAVVYPDKGARWKLTDLVAWHNEMAEYLRAVDAYRRPVSTNTASNCLGWEQTYNWDPTKYDDRLLLLHEKMDFANHHIYTEEGPEVIERTAARFCDKVPGKPLLLGEWGLTPYFDQAEKHVTVPVGLHNAIWMALTTCATTPYHWFWDKYYEVGGLKHYQTVAEFLEGEDPVRDRLAFATPSASGPVPLKAYGMCGERRALVWVWDPRSRQGQPEPGRVTGARLTIEGLSGGEYAVRFRDTWTGEVLGERRATHGGGALTLEVPAFVRDVAVKVEE